MNSPSPFVTLILPVRNEEQFITRCLDAILAQDYPREQLEIIVVDGMSSDATRAIVTKIAAYDTRILMLDNPRGIVPTGLNIGLARARGEVMIRIDGHTLIAPDYVSRCVAALDASGADNAGGAMNAVGESPVARAIAVATSSRFGVGGARFHYAQKPGWVDTVYLGAFRRGVFERVGNFDEELVRNQDDEFNFRLARAGGKIWLDPAIRSQYFSRATFRGLWKQYFEYGYYKVRVMSKHGRPASWRHLAPGALVLGLVGSAGASAAFWSIWPVAIVAGGYLSGVLAAAVWTAARQRTSAALVYIAFLILHLGYGTGFWTGVVKWNLARK